MILYPENAMVHWDVRDKKYRDDFKRGSNNPMDWDGTQDFITRSMTYLVYTTLQKDGLA